MAELDNIPKKYKVVSSRAYYWGKRIMKPGQVFFAFERDLPEEFKLMIMEMDLPVKQPEVQESSFRSATYRIKERKGGEYYDVIDSNGKKMNEKQLSKEEAEELVKKL